MERVIELDFLPIPGSVKPQLLCTLKCVPLPLTGEDEECGICGGQSKESWLGTEENGTTYILCTECVTTGGDDG